MHMQFQAVGMHASMYLFCVSIHPALSSAADHPSKAGPSDLLQVALQRFQDAKESMVMRFKDGKTDITIVVWDFGGQTVCSADDSKGN